MIYLHLQDIALYMRCQHFEIHHFLPEKPYQMNAIPHIRVKEIVSKMICFRSH